MIEDVQTGPILDAALRAPRTLIVGTAFNDSAHKSELLRLWAALIEKLSPECDVLVVDSCSPRRTVDILQPFGYTQMVVHNGAVAGIDCPTNDKRRVARFSEDVGTLPKGGKDGPGQALCFAIESAINLGYDYVAHLETDQLFLRPVGPIIERMHKAGVKIAAPMDFTYSFIETQALFMSVPWLKERDYIGAYDWERPEKRGVPFHEVWLERFAGDDLFCLPLRGCRNDLDKITVTNINMVFPWGMDFLSHCKDFNLYLNALEMAGIQL